MNRFPIIAVFLVVPILSHAQEEEFQTIFHKNNGEKMVISAFGGPFMQFTTIDKDFVLMIGGGGGIMLGNIFFGGYGVGKSNEIPFKSDNTNSLGFGHGGLWMGYTLFPKKSIHLSLSTQAGWGSISKKLKLPNGDYKNIDSNPITVITPIVEVEFNLSRYFKIGTGASWSYVSGLSNASPYTNKDFSTPSFILSFKFGWFD
jgi:hypothetical protein